MVVLRNLQETGGNSRFLVIPSLWLKSVGNPPAVRLSLTKDKTSLIITPYPEKIEGDKARSQNDFLQELMT